MLEEKIIADKLKKMIVERLKLKVEPEEIKDEDPLFGEGLGLDSVEALEVVVGIEEVFGVTIEDEDVMEEFYSIETLTKYVKKLIKDQGVDN